MVDTNVLVRAFVDDNATQAKLAADVLDQADLVAVSLQTLCEYAWVLDRRYRASRAQITDAIQQLIDTQKVVVNRPAAAAGLSMLAGGSDFADGIIAHEGRWLGGETFISFDRKAVGLLQKEGRLARSP